MRQVWLVYERGESSNKSKTRKIKQKKLAFILMYLKVGEINAKL